MRALARLEDEGLVRRVGLANVNRAQLDEALGLAPVAAVQVSLSVLDDRALRGGVVERCAEAGIAVIAHSPLGGPRRARSLDRHPGLAAVAENHGATAAEAALAWCSASARTSSRSRARGSRRQRARRPAPLRSCSARPSGSASPVAWYPRRVVHAAGDAEVVLVMGIPGAGKSRVAEAYAARDHLRLNRDERGGTLRALADELETALASGARRVVLDNTYSTRASRSHVVEAAARHGAPVRCVWLDTPLAQAQVNMIDRLLDRFGSLPTPEELEAAARKRAWSDGADVPDARAPRARTPRTRRGLRVHRADTVLARAARGAGRRVRRGVRAAGGGPARRDRGRRPDRPASRLRLAAGRLAGRPRRRIRAAAEGRVRPDRASRLPARRRSTDLLVSPSLPGLLLAFARAYGVDPERSTLVGTSPPIARWRRRSTPASSRSNSPRGARSSATSSDRACSYSRGAVTWPLSR